MKKIFSSKIFLWTRKNAVFTNLLKIVWWNCRVFHSKPKKPWADNFFRKNTNTTLFLWKRKIQFWQFCRKRFAGRMTIFAQTPKKLGLHLFLKMCSPEKILCISRMQSSFSRCKDVAIRAKSCRSMSKKRKIRTFPIQHLSAKLIPRKVRMHVFITTTNVLSKIPKKKIKKS